MWNARGRCAMSGHRQAVLPRWNSPRSRGDRSGGAAAAAAQAETLPVGSRAFHQRFGSGTIRAAEDDRLEVDFDKAGEKRVLNQFVEKA